MKMALIALALLVLVTGAWFWLRSPDTPPVAAASETISAAKPAAISPDVSTQEVRQPKAPSTQPIAATDNAESEVPVSSVDAALQSMQHSLSEGDQRTPELAPEYEREKPTPEVLADPARYAEYEESQTRKIASVYLSMLSQIPLLRARIESARTAGSKSAEELAEAEEALAKLEALKQEIEKTHPEMLAPKASDPAATPTAPASE